MRTEIKSTLARGTGGGLLARSAGVGIGFLSHVLLARLLQAEEYSRYIYVLTWLNVLVLLGKAGLDTATLRFVAAYRSSGEAGRLRGFLRKSRSIGFTVSVLVAATAGAVVTALSGRLDPVLYSAFLVSCLALPVNGLLAIRSACLQAMKQVIRAELPQSVARPALTLAGAWLLFRILGRAPRSDETLGAYLAAGILALVVVEYWNRSALSGVETAAPPEYETGLWVKTAMPLLLISGFHLVLNQTDTLMLGMIRSTGEAGAYAVASRVTQLIFLGQWAVNAIAAPMFSELHHGGKKERLQEAATYAARAAFLVTVPLAFGLVFFGRQVLAIFSSEFTVAWTALAILAAGQIIHVLCGSVGLLMTMTGRENAAGKIIGMAAVLNIVLNAVLIPRFGLEGAAVSTAVSTAFWNITLVFLVRKRIGIRSTVL
ncbi:MAG: flippase [Acidobacteria bacterium]|uniref:Flippase n=1 Tax=Candidatus Polarisedimenticola svalbardensis TaxID=2886004 RepID=A0A8J7C1M1_9BACT|nr:flippase [Candidatus Polarisedimenticola svalbardensis]